MSFFPRTLLYKPQNERKTTIGTSNDEAAQLQKELELQNRVREARLKLRTLHMESTEE